MVYPTLRVFIYPKSIKHIDWLIGTWRRGDEHANGEIVDYKQNVIFSLRKDSDLSNSERSVWQFHVKKIGDPEEILHPSQKSDKSMVIIVQETGVDELGVIIYDFAEIKTDAELSQNSDHFSPIFSFETEQKHIIWTVDGVGFLRVCCPSFLVVTFRVAHV